MTSCSGDACLTCSDEAVPVRVREVRADGMALVETEDATVEEVSVALVDAAVGDVVLVHAKEAIAVVDSTGRPEALYPFLTGGGDLREPVGTADLASILAEVTRSTAEKAREIVALRHDVERQLGTRIAACAGAMAVAFRAGGRLFTFGNGGSSTDAASVASLFLSPGHGAPALPAICLPCDVALLTALTNDVGSEVVFARQIAALGRPGDIALGLSTSGGSANVLRGFAEARRRGMVTVGLAGSGGGAMAEVDTVDHLFVIPSASVHRIQEAQTTVYQVLWELTQQALVPAG